MQKFFMLAALLVGSTNMFGAALQCTPLQGDILNVNGGTSTVFNCAGQGAALDSIVFTNLSISVLANGGVTGVAAPGPIYTATVTISNDGGYVNPVHPGLSCQAVTDPGSGINGCSTGNVGTFANTALANVDVIGGFTVTVTGAPGANALRSGTASVFYNATELNTSGVPEPSTFALLGSALVGLGLLSRRRS